MGFKRPPRQGGADDIPTSSFSDIAFLLIIFFILVTSLQQFTGFKTDLPSGEQSQEEQDEEMPTVKLHNDSITFGEEPVNIEELRRELAGLKLTERASEDDRLVIIEATGNTTYQSYYQVMAAIRKAGGVVGILKEGEQK